MLKLVGSLGTLVASVFMGYISSKKFKLRLEFLNQYLNFIKYIETEITYSSSVIYDLIKNYYVKNHLALFMKLCCKKLEQGYSLKEAWHDSIFNISDYGLSYEDKKIIDNFGNHFGKSDKKGQIAFCDFNEQLINMQISIAKKDKDEKAKLYFMLWVSLGLGTVLMLM